MTQMMQEILKLSVADRIVMVEAIWDSISGKEQKIQLSRETKNLLDDRLNAHEQNKDEGSSWQEVKERIKKQL